MRQRADSRVVGRFLLVLLLSVVGAEASPAEGPDGEAAEAAERLRSEGDRAWTRHWNVECELVESDAVEAALAAYEAALEADPLDLEARWKLLRGLYVQGVYVLSEDERPPLLARVLAESQEAIARLEATLAGRREEPVPPLEKLTATQAAELYRGVDQAAPIFYWAAVGVGYWGQHAPMLEAAMQGVAGKLRLYSEIVIALDPAYEDAGGHRVLGRMHAVAPKVPFFTGWVDRARGVAELRRAVEIAPQDPLNGLFFAEALLAHEKRSKQEAIAALQEVAGRSPRAARGVADRDAIDQAKRLLAELGAASPPAAAAPVAGDGKAASAGPSPGDAAPAPGDVAPAPLMICPEEGCFCPLVPLVVFPQEGCFCPQTEEPPPSGAAPAGGVEP